MSNIIVDRDGTIRFVYDDGLRSLLNEGRASIRRASHVEPTAEGTWTADMGPSSGPVLGPFETRGQALAAEVEWLQGHGF